MSDQPKGYAGGAAQWIGMLVFLGGVVLMALTFTAAWHMFQDPSLLLKAVEKPGNPTQNLTAAIFVVVIKIAMLFAMMLAGSLVAVRGIQLFGAGRKS